MRDPLPGALPLTTAALGLRGTRPIALLGCLPPGPRIAVVGSRAAWRDRIAAVSAIVSAAKETGCTLVSGGALGIDAAAHRAALELGVPQVAVLPCGPDQPYPARNLPLFRDIVAAGGAIVFGRPRGCPANRGVFASRNRIVVELATRVVVAQASLRSGSMSTGRLTLRMGKPLAVLDGQPSAAVLASAGARLIALSADIEAIAAATRSFIADEAIARAPWPDNLLQLRAALDRAGPTGLAVDSLSPALMLALVLAEADGWVGSCCAGRYVALR